MTTREIGTKGESFAAQVLQKNGAEILSRNYYTPYGEIDLIVRDGNCIAFVEVKAQRGEYNIWELPAPKEETKETIEVNNKNDLSGLSEMVKSDREIAETIEVEDNVKDAKAIEKSEENHEVR